MTAPRPKGMRSEDARRIRAQGYNAEQEFAGLIGGKVYTHKGTRKKDVGDAKGDYYSVKAGAKKWQIFLYSKTRFLKDTFYQALNGIGDVLIRCLDAFPDTHEDYEADKPTYKEILKAPMRDLQGILSKQVKMKAFLKEALFTDGIDYLAVKDGKVFHVFPAEGVLNVLADMTVVNSQKRAKNQTECQKVVFKREGKTIGEIEIRTDPKNYRMAKFWMSRPLTLEWLLESKIKGAKKVGPKNKSKTKGAKKVSPKNKSKTTLNLKT